MIVRWTEKAFLSLEEITHYIADDDVEAAIRTAQQIYDRVEDLIMFPHRGRPGRKQRYTRACAGSIALFCRIPRERCCH